MKKTGRNSKTRKKSSSGDEELELFGSEEQYVLTLRIPADINDALDRYIARNTTLQRQKKKTIIFALRKFLEEKGEF